jgi:hypothetical protein
MILERVTRGDQEPFASGFHLLTILASIFSAADVERVRDTKYRH